MNYLQRFLLTSTLLFSVPSIAQTVIWQEDFDFTPCTGNPCDAATYVGQFGAWSVQAQPGNTGANANIWVVSCDEAGFTTGGCGDTCGGTPPPPPVAQTAQSLHITSDPNFVAVPGATYNAGGLAPFITIATDVLAVSPQISTVGSSTITLSFNYIMFGDGALDNGEVWYFDGLNWTPLATIPKSMCCSGGAPVMCTGGLQGLWDDYQVVLPASANNNPSVRIGFRWYNNDDGVGFDPSFAVDNVILTTGAAGSGSVAFGTVPPGPFCTGQTITIPFTSTGTFTGTNSYNVLLSDVNGAFLPGTLVGSLSSTANAGNISVTIPPGTTSGNSYFFQLASTSPVAVSTAVGPFTIAAVETLSVNVTAGPSVTICAGDSVGFTANVLPVTLNNVSYQWLLNNNPIPGATGATYFSTSLSNGANISVTVTTTDPCIQSNPATSAGIAITVTSNINVTATIVPNPAGTICSGDTVVFSSTLAGGGATPGYQWLINGVPIPGATNDSLTLWTLNTGDAITMVGTSSVTCATNNPDTSNIYTANVVSSGLPTITVVSDTNVVCAGDPVTFTANWTNGGPLPAVQWYVNGVLVPGANDTTYTVPLTQDVFVYASVVSSLPCVNPIPVFADTVFVTVNPIDTVTVSISNIGVCEGQNATFTSVLENAGNGSQVLWSVNGDFVGTGPAIIIPADNLQTGDTIIATVNATNPCVVDAVVSSDPFIVVILQRTDITVESPVSILYGDTTALTITPDVPVNPTSFIWSPDSTLSCRQCPDPFAFPTTNTWFNFVYRSPSGCLTRDSIFVEVKPNYEVFIPSAFSPNNDGRNEVLYVRGIFIEEVHLKIYDRFGHMVFESRQQVYGWDGKQNYRELNAGVYLYVVDIVYKDRTTKTISGNVTLLR